jgi:membrane protein required for colicin V production
MGLLDLLIVAFMVFLIVRGIFRGFVREVGSLAGIVLGIWAACVYHPQMTAVLSRFLPPWEYLPLVGMALVMIAVLVLFNVAAWLLHKFIKKVFLGWADRTLGAGLAVLKGIVMVHFAILVVTFFVPPASSFIADSRLAPVVVRSYQAMIGVISPETYEKMKKTFTGHKERIASSLGKDHADPKGNHGR